MVSGMAGGQVRASRGLAESGWRVQRVRPYSLHLLPTRPSVPATHLWLPHYSQGHDSVPVSGSNVHPPL